MKISLVEQGPRDGQGHRAIPVPLVAPRATAGFPLPWGLWVPWGGCGYRGPHPGSTTSPLVPWFPLQQGRGGGKKKHIAMRSISDVSAEGCGFASRCRPLDGGRLCSRRLFHLPPLSPARPGQSLAIAKPDVPGCDAGSGPGRVFPELVPGPSGCPAAPRDRSC